MFLQKALPSGKNIFKDRVAWAKTYLVKAGLVQQPKRAYCEISALGKSIELNKIPDTYVSNKKNDDIIHVKNEIHEKFQTDYLTSLTKNIKQKRC